MSDPTREVRYCAVAPIELREDTDKPLAVTGYAAVFGERTAIGPLDKWGWEEVVEAGAFSAALDRRDDICIEQDHQSWAPGGHRHSVRLPADTKRHPSPSVLSRRGGGACRAEGAGDSGRTRSASCCA